MNGLKCAAILVAALGLTALACAADEGSVTISSPADGSKLSGSSAKIAYEVVPGPRGEHVHVYVDGEETARLHQLKGNYTVDKLSVGKHWVCIRVVDKAHVPVGVEKCVGVMVGSIPSMGY